MKYSMTAKVFVAVLATSMLVALSMGIAAHVNLTRGFLGYLNEQAVQRLDLSVPGVTAGYRSYGGWDFLRQRPELWWRLLRPGAADTILTDSVQDPPPPTVSDLTGATRRFTLLDAQRRRVAGFDAADAQVIERAITVDGRTVGWLTLAPFQSVSSAAERRFADGQLHASWAVGLGALLLAAAIALWVSRALLKPVQQVAAATHQLAAGDYSTRVQVSASDEVGALARDFNLLALSLQRTEEMRRQFMADLSHELLTPLGVLHGELEAIEDGVRSPTALSIRSLQAEVATLNKLVSDLYDLSLADVGALAYRKTDLDVVALLELAAQTYRERLAAVGVTLELQLADKPLLLFADERRLQQLFNNLFENSCRYTDSGGRLLLRLSADKAQVSIDFMDTPPGVIPAQLPRLFERFFRAEGSRNRSSGGAGLGLAISKRIVEAHDGQIEARASPLGGLWIAVTLPRLRA